MNKSEFTEVVKRHFVGKFELIQWGHNSGRLEFQNGVFSFPSLVCVSEFKDHFIAEFFGDEQKFAASNLKWSTKKHLRRNVDTYFNQFPDEENQPLIKFSEGTRAFTIGNMAISNSPDVENSLQRIGMHVGPDTTVLIGAMAKPSTISMAKRNCSAFFYNVALINARENIARAKCIKLLIVSTKDLSSKQLADDFQYLEKFNEDETPIELAIRRSSRLDASAVIRSQFSSLYQTESVRETGLGFFFDQHPEILAKALGGIRFEFETQLPWAGEHASSKSPIKPDILFEREDGSWHICDLKTAKLFEDSLLTGGPARLRPKDYVHEGIAQLRNYHDYFRDADCAKYAEETHGIRVTNPELFLIVGDRDNLPDSELKEACGYLDDRYHIMDYDTIANLYVGGL